MAVIYSGNVTGTSHYEQGWRLVTKNRPEYLTLKRDPANPYDKRATGVFFGDIQVGWIPKSKNYDIARWLDEGRDMIARVSEINKDSSDFQNRLFITVSMAFEEPVLAPATDESFFNHVSSFKEPQMANQPAVSINSVIDKNKSTAVSAAFMEAGRIANAQLVKVAGKQLPVMVRGYADTPVGRLVIANLANLAAQHLRPEDTRLGKLTSAMMVQAYQQLLGEFDIEQIIEDLLANASIKKALKTVDTEA